MKNKLKQFAKKVSTIWKLAGLYVLKFIHRFYRPIVIGLITAIILFAEWKLITYPANDLTGIVFGWTRTIKANGFASFWKTEADYSPIFLFFCAIVSLFPEGEHIKVNNVTFEKNWIILFKGFYILCVIGMAIGIYLITKLLTKDKNKATISYVVTLVLPTIIMNSAVWGNSDSTLGLTLIFALYLALIRKDYWAFFLLGLSFGNKLQAVFIVPFFALLIVNRKLKLHAIIFAFFGFILTFVPSWICGAPFGQPFSYVGVQLGRWNNLTYGCANMWHLLNFKGDVVNKASTWIGLGLIGTLLALVHLRHIDLENKQNLFKLSVLLIFAVVFFLPHMHERYFYLIEVLVVIYAIINPKRFYLPILMQLSGAIAYYHYLSGKYFIQSWGEDSVHIASFINLFVFGVLIYDTFKMDHRGPLEEDIKTFDEEIKQIKQENTKKEISAN